MIRIGPVSIALMGAIVVNVFFALLLPTAAQATCSGIWEASGQWSAVQSNGATPKFQILNTPTGLRGSAEYYAGVGYLQQLVHGSADGAISRDNFQLTVYWENGSKGVYTGTVGPQGRIEGYTYDAQYPQSMATWYSDRPINCFTGNPSDLIYPPKKPVGGGGTGPYPAIGPIGHGPPVKSLGRVNPVPGTTLAPPLPICDAAREARARNNAAAPGLEAQCRATVMQGR